jgi:hypothetical protein
VLLSERADIYRVLEDKSHPGRKNEQAWRRNTPCHLEPISAIDHTVSFALESTHVIFLPGWFLGLRKEDVIRLGGRITSAGGRAPLRYIVKGVRRFPSFGLHHIAAYCEERE